MGVDGLPSLLKKGREYLPERICEVTSTFGLVLADLDQIRQARAISAALVGEGVAATETFVAVQQITQSSVFVYCEDGAVTGVLGLFFLRQAGLDAIEKGAFDAVNLDLDLVARPGEAPAAGYGWGFAATTHAGGRAVVKASAALRDTLFWGLPAFTRTATPDGVRVILGSLGYKPYGQGQTTLVWLPALNAAPVKAAP